MILFNLLKRCCISLIVLASISGCEKEHIKGYSTDIEEILKAEANSPVPLSASILVSKNDNIIYKGSITSSEIPIDSNVNNKYFIASITKHFTAVSVLKLYSQGKINLNQKVSEFIPDIPGGNHMTIQHLLSHQTGLVRDIITVYDSPISLDSLISLVSKTKLQFQPGSKFSYANPNYLILSKIIEITSGESYFDYINNQLIKPLKLSETGQKTTLDQNIPNLVQGLSIGYDSLKDITTVVPSIPFLSSSRYGAGALYSSIDDLHTYLQAFKSGKVLPDSLKELMITPTSENYSTGFFIDENKIWHTGRTYGYRTGIYMYPKNDIEIIFLSNYDRSRRNEVISNIESLLLGKPYKLPKTAKVLNDFSIKEYQKILGKYLLEGDTQIQISTDSSNLYIDSHGGARELIYPISNDSLVSLMRDMQLSFSNPISDKSDTLYWTFRGDRFACPRIE